MRKQVINRNVYKQIKKYDHSQMCEFLTRYYINGYNDGVKETQDSASLDYEKLRKVLVTVKGIGEVKADAIIKALHEVEND